MKIKIKDIKAEGSIINDTIPLVNINNRLNQASSNDIVFLSDPKIQLNLKKTGSTIKLSGSLKAEYSQPCSLCIDNLKHEINTELNYIIKEKKIEEKATDDIGIMHYHGDHLDLEDIIQEALILKLKPFKRPEVDQEDKCRVCNKDTKNMFSQNKEGIVLGELFKKINLG